MRFLAATLRFLLGLTGSLVAAQTPDPLLVWMDQIAQQELDQRAREIASIHTVPAMTQRQNTVRQRLYEVLGGLPDYPWPLHVRLTGQLHNEFYTVDKVLFQSLRGFYVTANVYHPNVLRRYPAVLLQAGHTQEGKPEPQITAANLAMKGFVAMTFDPIGQGEREQTYLRDLGRPLSGGAGNEHIQAGAQSLLLGQSVARYFIYDAKRALDYLISRPDVDPARVGAAGCSGGGALTTFVGALDTRVKAVAPACFIDSYRLLFSGPDPDSEMSLPAFLAKGLDIPDFIELRAPTPWLLLATREDYFTPTGARMAYDEAHNWFSLLNAPDHLRLFVGPGPHGTPRESREEIYGWMIRWLNNDRGDVQERPVTEYTNHQLQVTRTGHVDDEPGSRKLYQLILDEYRDNKSQSSISDLIERMRALQIPSTDPAPIARVIQHGSEPGYQLQQIRFTSEPGIEVAARLYLPPGSAPKPGVVVVADRAEPVPLHVSRSASTTALADALARAGRVVLEITPRESTSGNDGRPFLGDWLSNERADQIGRNLPAMRAHDILRGVDFLSGHPAVDPQSIRGAARGVKGIWLLFAAAVDPRLKKIWLDRTPYSYQDALQRPLALNLFDAVIPGFALHWDLNDLVTAMGDRSVLWTDPTNWMDATVALGPRYVYRTVRQSDEALIERFLK